MSIADILDGFSDNPFLGASFGLFSLGASVAILNKRLPGAVIHFRKQLLVKLKAPFREESYKRFLQWMIRRSAKKTKQSSETVPSVQNQCELVKKNLELIPLIETYSYEDRYKYMGLPLRTAKLAAFAKDHNMYIDIFEDARQMRMQCNEKKQTPMVPGWLPFFRPQHQRPLESIVRGEGISANVLKARNDLTTYPRWCISPGNTNRLEYFLYGLPNCRKSSIITTPAAEIDYGIYLWNLSERLMRDDLLKYLLKGDREKAILVLDDIDGIPVQQGVRQASAYEEFNRVLLSEKCNSNDFKFMSGTRRYPWLANSMKAYRTQFLPNNLVLSKRPIIGATTPLIVKPLSRNC